MRKKKEKRKKKKEKRKKKKEKKKKLKVQTYIDRKKRLTESEESNIWDRIVT